MEKSQHRSSPKLWFVLAGLLVFVLLVAAIGLLFTTAKLQQQLLTKEPAYEPVALYNKGVEQLSKGDYAAAEGSLEQALKAQDDATYRGQLAVVKYRLKKYSESIEHYQSLIKEGKDAAFAWNGIGNAYRDWAASEPARASETTAQAIQAYKQAIILNPLYEAAYTNLAILQKDGGDTAAALATLDEGIAATKSNSLSETRKKLVRN